MATAQHIKDFFSLIGKTLTNQHLLKAQQALADTPYGRNPDGSPRTPTADDLIAWIYHLTKTWVNARTIADAQPQATVPPEDMIE